MRRLKWIGAIAALWTLGLACGASAQDSGLEFVEPESVAVTVSDGTSDPTSVWLKNTTGATVRPVFKAVLEDSDGDEVLSTVKVDSHGTTPRLRADDVGRFRIHLEEGAESSGQLVATAEGGSVPPATVPLSVGAKSLADHGVDGALLIPLVAALVLIAIAWFFSVRPVSLTDPLGTLELKFTESFASTLTAVGVLLGTIITAGVLPEETVSLSKAGFTGLNLIFGIAIAAAAVVYSALQKPVWKDIEKDPTKQERKFQGYVWPFLLAALITVWAVFGELWTLWLLVNELGQDNGFSSLAVVVIKALLVGAAVGMVPYTILRIKGTVKSRRDKPNAAAAFAPAAPEPERSVSLL